MRSAPVLSLQSMLKFRKLKVVVKQRAENYYIEHSFNFQLFKKAKTDFSGFNKKKLRSL